MTRRVLKILGVTLLGLGCAAAGFVRFRFLTPSGNVEEFRAYYVRQSDGMPSNGAVKVTFLGTSTLLIDDGETQLMTDGFLSRPSLWTVATSKIATDPAVVDAALARVKADRLKAIFVAHSHYDHAMDAPYVARKTGATLHGSASTLNVGRGGGLSESQLALYAPGKPLTIGRFVVTVLASKHTPAVKGVNDDLGQTIDAPLQPPARASAYKEGGAFDVLIQRGARALLVKASTNYVEGGLDGVHADVLFLGTAMLGLQEPAFQNAFYLNTVGKVHPQQVIPIHWDDFFQPLSDHLEPLPKFGDNLAASFGFMIARLSADKIQFSILRGYESVMLFSGGET